jgi:Bacterial Ig-like domain (group 3)
MKLRLSSAVAGVSTLVASAGIVLLGGVAAHAATTPPYEPDPQSVGTISLFNSSGIQITSGSIDDAPIAAYAVGSSTIRAGDTRAQLQMAQPNPSAATSGFNADSLTGLTTFPPASGPADITSQTNPVVTGSSGDLTVDDFIQEFPNTDPSGLGCAYAATPAGCTNTSYQNLYQLRLKTANSGGFLTSSYDVADILVSGTAGHQIWTQVYPAAKTATTTTLTPSPSPAIVGATVTLTAVESPAVAGSVQFMDGASNIGAAVAVDGTGKAVTTTSTLALGSHSLSAVFTPTDTTDNAGSTGTATLVVNPAATPTKTALAVSQDGIAGDPISMTGTVTAPGGPVASTDGAVEFFDGSTDLGPGTFSSAGQWGLSLPSGLSAGSHSITAVFTPADPTKLEASTGGPSTFLLTATTPPGSPCDPANGGQCTDTQNIQTSIPTGALVINTPYTPANPLILPNMALNAAGTEFTTSAGFDCIAVTDTTSGGLPFVAQALALPLQGSNLPSPLPAGAFTTINSENVGLTNLTKSIGGDTLCSDTQTYSGATGTTDNPAAEPAVPPSDGNSFGLGGTTPHNVITGSGGVGTVTYGGKLTINAPTATASGLYQGTITFTVSD